MQHQVDGIALRHQQVPAVPEGVQHNHQQAGLTCRTSSNHTPQLEACCLMIQKRMTPLIAWPI
jgi:hypothetical protein